MPDTVDKETRSRMMSCIKSKNTRPELLIRKALHRKGFRFRLHPKNAPGRPDIVLPRWRVAILVHGCFWHGHDCHLFRLPSTRRAFWEAKISRNRERDAEVCNALRDAGWRVMVIWECALKGRTRVDSDILIDRLCSWIGADQSAGEIAGVCA